MDTARRPRVNCARFSLIPHACLQVKEATNSDPFGPAGATLSDLSDVSNMHTNLLAHTAGTHSTLVYRCHSKRVRVQTISVHLTIMHAPPQNLRNPPLQIVSKSPEARQEALSTLLMRLEDTPDKWRKIYKALVRVACIENTCDSPA